MSVAFMFPGQGSQAVGMGKDVCERYASAREVFDEVDEALGEKLSETIWNGPDDRLTLTENAQPALMAMSLAVVRVLEKDKGFDLAAHAAFVAGHSLGEYSALAAAGALGVSDAAQLLRTRGQAMQAAVPVGEGAMAAMLGIQLDKADELAKAAAEGEVCQTANDNAPGQVVLSGAKSAVERAVAMAKDFGARRAVLLNVSAPFHSALMAPAAAVMKKALGEVEISEPRVPVVANVVAGPISDPDEIRRRLVEQVTATVRWRESIGFMASAGVTTFNEVGSGRVLSGLVRQIDRSLATAPVGTCDEIDALANTLGA
ncbi:MAG: ACP S-malonyltransferase [Hyphomicrobiaceae bacterium]